VAVSGGASVHASLQAAPGSTPGPGPPHGGIRTTARGAEAFRACAATLTQRVQPPPLTAADAWVAPGYREEQRAVARHGLTPGGMTLKWPHTIDRYREGSEADAASVCHQAKPH
jgi:hypothetical protein